MSVQEKFNEVDQKLDVLVDIPEQNVMNAKSIESELQDQNQMISGISARMDAEDGKIRQDIHEIHRVSDITASNWIEHVRNADLGPGSTYHLPNRLFVSGHCSFKVCPERFSPVTRKVQTRTISVIQI
jgi:hypothetical protein